MSADTFHTISPFVAETLRYYVYIYVDPRSNDAFYVGKGKGNRAIAHLNDSSDSKKVQRISEIRKMGFEPRIA